ncbi:inositol monophosphatase [Actinoplanes sichuanensis]|uniref:Inositol monophosphatase family protein n=1 Tax=Actinoplanes sichuanensis TaxID=512349 RepID=A0ABW4ABK9_9ACTN|nr:inositol monophosphatase family protein [Actinoplanes sichuanensis]BEL05396.1 inositol monophosphatase [Actinoplanes sichuanensis]
MTTAQQLLTVVTAAVHNAADLVTRPARTPTTKPELVAALAANDDAVSAALRPVLTGALAGSQWTSDEHGSGPMPDGDWWVVDPVGGNMNAVQGMPDWNIGVSLVRDGRPVLAVLHMPVAGETFTAITDHGATANGVPLKVSAKTDLTLALTGTGQARPGREAGRADRAGAAVAAMMRHALYVRASVPVGHQLAQVAAGRMDLHWQFDNLRSHIAPVLIVQEAGGVVTDFDGKPWTVSSDGYVAAAPGVHSAALDVLRPAR